jgi:hypothetical protein
MGEVRSFEGLRDLGPGKARLRHAAQAVLIALALFLLGAGIVRRSCHVADGAASQARRTGHPEPAKGLREPSEAIPPAKSPVLQAAGELYTTRQILTRSLRKLNNSGISLSPEELLLVRQLEGRISEHTRGLKAALGADPSGWPELVDFLGRLPDSETALCALQAVRESMTPSDAASILASLSTEAPTGVRRLWIFSLGNYGSEEVVSAMARLAVEDSDPALRKAALQSLGDRRNQLKGTPSGVLVDETLKRQSVADPDPETRDCARALLEPAPEPLNPVRVPRPSRGPFGRG